MAIIPWNKKYGETLNTTLVRFRDTYPEYLNSKITYAGRLDPMAEGLVILLTDEDVHKKQEYLDLNKTYVVEFILGVSTDSYDILGRITKEYMHNASEIEVEKSVKDLLVITRQRYPAYSSKTVYGKPLWQWEREGGTENIPWPSRQVKIFKIDYQGSRNSEVDIFKKELFESIRRVEGDFRQLEILAAWEVFFEKQNEPIVIHRMIVDASSGTYMRTLVDTLGEQLGTGATSIKIQRTAVGEYQHDIDK